MRRHNYQSFKIQVANFLKKLKKWNNFEILEDHLNRLKNNIFVSGMDGCFLQFDAVYQDPDSLSACECAVSIYGFNKYRLDLQLSIHKICTEIVCMQFFPNLQFLGRTRLSFEKKVFSKDMFW